MKFRGRILIFILLVCPLHSFSLEEHETSRSIELNFYFINNPKFIHTSGEIPPESNTVPGLGLDFYFIPFLKTKRFTIEGGCGIGNNTVSIAPKMSQAFYDSSYFTKREIKTTFLGTVYLNLLARMGYLFLENQRHKFSLQGGIDMRFYLPLDFETSIGYVSVDHNYYEISAVEMDNGWNNLPVFSFSPQIGFLYQRKTRKNLWGVGIDYRFPSPDFLLTYKGAYVFSRGLTEESSGTFTLNEAGIAVRIVYGF